MPATKPLLALLFLAFSSNPLVAQDKKVGSIKASKDQLDFMVGDALVTRYVTNPKYAKPFFFPVLAPNGASLTRTWPISKDIPGEATDHVHQKSLWFCHGDVIPEGMVIKDKVKGVEGVDFWAESKGHGNIVCTKVGDPKTKGGHSWVTTHNEWRMADGTKIMDEERVIHFYVFDKSRLLVLDIDLDASVCPITFGDTKEGAIGYRINDQIATNPDKSVSKEIKGKGMGKLENSNGKVGEKDCWGHLAAWTDYSGTIDGKAAGLAILDDPKNPYPACWHIRGYGLNAANPFGRAKSGFPDMKGKKDLVKLAKGEHLKLRYGVVLHDGDAAAGGVPEVFQRFVDLRGKE
jgi:Methane oxygenase PmoA